MAGQLAFGEAGVADLPRGKEAPREVTCLASSKLGKLGEHLVSVMAVLVGQPPYLGAELRLAGRPSFSAQERSVRHPKMNQDGGVN